MRVRPLGRRVVSQDAAPPRVQGRPPRADGPHNTVHHPSSSFRPSANQSIRPSVRLPPHPPTHAPTHTHKHAHTRTRAHARTLFRRCVHHPPQRTARTTPQQCTLLTDTPGFTSPFSTQQVGKALLAGELDYRRGRFSAAFDHLRRAVALEAALPYDEPSGWVRLVRLSAVDHWSGGVGWAGSQPFTFLHSSQPSLVHHVS